LCGLQPLCGIGVTSRITLIINPASRNPLKAASRPTPAPLIRTPISFMPCFAQTRARLSAACFAARVVFFRVPLKPQTPDDDQAKVLPFKLLIVIIVLLKVDCI